MLALVVCSVEHLGVSWREIGHKVRQAGVQQDIGATRAINLEKTARARAIRISLYDRGADRRITSRHVIVADIVSEIGNKRAERHIIISADIVNVESKRDLIVHNQRVLNKTGFDQNFVLFGVGLSRTLRVYNT